MDGINVKEFITDLGGKEWPEDDLPVWAKETLSEIPKPKSFEGHVMTWKSPLDEQVQKINTLILDSLELMKDSSFRVNAMRVQLKFQQLRIKKVSTNSSSTPSPISEEFVQAEAEVDRMMNYLEENSKKEKETGQLINDLKEAQKSRNKEAIERHLKSISDNNHLFHVLDYAKNHDPSLIREILLYSYDKQNYDVAKRCVECMRMEALQKTVQKDGYVRQLVESLLEAQEENDAARMSNFLMEVYKNDNLLEVLEFCKGNNNPVIKTILQTSYRDAKYGVTKTCLEFIYKNHLQMLLFGIADLGKITNICDFKVS